MKKNQLQITNLKMLLLITAMLLSVSWVQAQTYITTSTNWSALSPQPTSATQLIVKSGATLTVNVADAVCASIGLGMGHAGGGGAGGGTLAFSANSQLTVSGAVTIGGVQGRTSYTGTVDMTNGGKLICNSFALSGTQTKTFTQGTGTVELPATNTLPTSIVTTFNNLIISGGTTTLGTSIAVNGTLTQNGGDIAVGSNTLTVNGTHNAGTNIVTGAGTYTIANTGTLITANLNGITTSGATGTIQTNTRIYNTAANYRFNGAADQVTGNGLPATVSSFRVQNIGGIVTLSNASLSATILTIDAGAKLTVSSGQSLSATSLYISSDATNGTGTLVNGGSASFTTANVTQSLVDANNTINVNRNWYLSAPVATGSTLPTGFTYWYYPESDANQGTNSGEYWLNPASTTEMMGYAVTAAPANSSITFTGKLNDGAKSIALSRTSGNPKTGFNLVGNPYPSYLTLSTTDVTGANLEQFSVWYRYVQSYNTETNKPVYAFETVPFGVSSIKVPPMQSFWVRTNTGGGTLQFANTQRSHAASGDPVFRAKAADGPQLLELFVTNGSNYDNTVIYFDSNFSDGLDPYDAYKMLNGSIVPDLYTTVNSSKLAYNSLSAIPYDTEISLFFTPNASTLTSYTISASKFSNFEAGTQVWIKNNQSGLSQLISDGSSFTFDVSQTGTNPKFSLILKAPGTTTELAKTEKSNIFVFANENRQITVNCNDAISSDAIVTVYNNVGQRVTSGKITKNRTVIEQPVTSGVYVVTVLNAGKTTAAKIIIQ